MHHSDHVTRVATALEHTDYQRHGMQRRAVAAKFRSGAWQRVGRNGCVEASTWQRWYAQDRHLASVLVAHRESHGHSPPVFSHVSAAVLLGLPLWGFRNDAVHMIAMTSHARSRTLIRHQLPLDERDIVEVDGMRCTGPDRTLIDLAATESEELLVGYADAHLRSQARSERTVDAAACSAWRERLRSHTRNAPGARGVRRLRRVIEFADARADSPLESISRLHFDRLGIEVEPQFAVPAPGGGRYFVDFRLVGLGVLGECDGAQKYLDPRMLGERSPGEAVLREKRRDDWITGTSGSRMIHWGHRETSTTEHFAAMLRAFGVPLPLRHR
ncbi:hypothetical protein ACWGOE_12495 [Leucobacter chromiiresistens]